MKQKSVFLFSLFFFFFILGNFKAFSASPTIQYDASSTVFPTLQSGQSMAKEIILKNSGSSDIVMGAFVPSMISGSSFKVDLSDCANKTLKANEATSSCKLIATFFPTSGGDFQFGFDLNIPPATDPLKITLTGKATGGVTVPPAIQYDASSTLFPELQSGQTVTKEIVLSNSGGTDLTFGAFSPSVIAGNSFRVDFSNCANQTLKANNSASTCKLLATFTPSSGGDFLFAFNLTVPSVADPLKITLTGKGIGNVIPFPPAPILNFNVGSIEFQKLLIGLKSDKFVVKISNPGSVSLTLSPKIEGKGANEFLLSGSCFQGAIPVNGSCDLEIQYVPQTEGILEVKVSLNSNDPKNSGEIFLKAEGTAIPLAADPNGGSGGCSLQRAEGASFSLFSMFSFVLVSVLWIGFRFLGSQSKEV